MTDPNFRIAIDAFLRFTWKPAAMNVAVQGIDADIRWNNEGSFHEDERADLKADFILANGSMSSQRSGGGKIRKAMIEADVVDAMVALPGQLLFSTQIPACLCILAHCKSANGNRDRQGEVLFIDARAGAYHRLHASVASGALRRRARNR